MDKVSQNYSSDIETSFGKFSNIVATLYVTVSHQLLFLFVFLALK